MEGTCAGEVHEDCSLWEGLRVGNSWRNVSHGSDGAALVGAHHPSSVNPAHPQGQQRCWEDKRHKPLLLSSVMFWISTVRISKIMELNGWRSQQKSGTEGAKLGTGEAHLPQRDVLWVSSRACGTGSELSASVGYF